MSGGEPTTGPLTSEELQLATRNRGMPLEALRYDVTPAGLHYLLVHFDIPYVDPEAWRLEIGGNVESPRPLGLDELRALPATTLPVTMECAGNGRARLTPRPVSQPWLVEAVSTAMWTGAPLRDVVRRPESAPTPSSSSSPAPTTACRAARSRTTRAASRWTRRSAPRCYWPTR